MAYSNQGNNHNPVDNHVTDRCSSFECEQITTDYYKFLTNNKNKAVVGESLAFMLTLEEQHIWVKNLN